MANAKRTIEAEIEVRSETALIRTTTTQAAYDLSPPPPPHGKRDEERRDREAARARFLCETYVMCGDAPVARRRAAEGRRHQREACN